MLPWIFNTSVTFGTTLSTATQPHNHIKCLLLCPWPTRPNSIFYQATRIWVDSRALVLLTFHNVYTHRGLIVAARPLSSLTSLLNYRKPLNSTAREDYNIITTVRCWGPRGLEQVSQSNDATNPRTQIRYFSRITQLEIEERIVISTFQESAIGHKRYG